MDDIPLKHAQYMHAFDYTMTMMTLTSLKPNCGNIGSGSSETNNELKLSNCNIDTLGAIACCNLKMNPSIRPLMAYNPNLLTSGASPSKVLQTSSEEPSTRGVSQ